MKLYLIVSSMIFLLFTIKPSTSVDKDVIYLIKDFLDKINGPIQITTFFCWKRGKFAKSFTLSRKIKWLK